MRSTTNINFPAVAYGALTFAFLCFVIWLKRDAPIGDFANYYVGSLALVNDVFGAWIYDPGEFNQFVDGLGFGFTFLNYTPVPPITAFYYLPLTLFDISTAKTLFNVLGAGLLSISTLRLFLQQKVEVKWMVFMPILCYAPIASNFAQGQTYAILAAFLIEGFLAYSRGRKWLAALLWVIPISLKIFPAIILLFLLSVKDFRTSVKLLAIGVGILVVSLFWIDISIWMEYASSILPRLMAGEINNPFSTSYQSFTVFLRGLLVHDAILNPGAFLDQPWLFRLLDALLKLIILGLFWRMMKSSSDTFHRFSLALLAGVLLSGYGSTYGLLVLLPFAVSTWKSSGKGDLLILGLLFLGMNFPGHWLSEMPALMQFPRLYLFITLFALLIWKLDVRMKLFEIGAIAVLSVVMSRPWMNVESNSELVVYGGVNLLTLDFQPTSDGLVVRNYDGSINQVEIPMQINSSEELVVKKVVALNEVPGNVKSIWRVNRSDVFYLSDEGRGVGFYALRKLRSDAE